MEKYNEIQLTKKMDLNNRKIIDNPRTQNHFHCIYYIINFYGVLFVPYCIICITYSKTVTMYANKCTSTYSKYSI